MVPPHNRGCGLRKFSAIQRLNEEEDLLPRRPGSIPRWPQIKRAPKTGLAKMSRIP